MESDSVYVAKQDNIELIDEAWTADALSDDEVDLGAENDAENDPEPGAPPVGVLRKEEEDEKWNDLGLENFSQ